jgi:hypothetical protein
MDDYYNMLFATSNVTYSFSFSLCMSMLEYMILYVSICTTGTSCNPSDYNIGLVASTIDP